MRICVLPTDTWGVGSYRVLQPGRELVKRGHEVFQYVDPGGTVNASQGNIPVANVLPHEDLSSDPEFDADLYVLQRRFEYGIPTTILKLRKAGKAVVVETDDLYDDLPRSSPGWKVLRDNPRRLSVDVLNVSMKVADAVTVSTPALAEHYSRYNANVHVLPNFLDWDMWENVRPQYEVEGRQRVRIGWMGWLAWRDNDLAMLRSFLGDWLREHPGVEFVSIGEPRRPGRSHLSVHDYLGVPKAQRRTVHGVPYRLLPEIVARIDVGLVPLEMTHFNECKSYLKGLEYAACGIPCVASPTQQYRQFVRDGQDGFLADTAAEWRDRLELLVADGDMRRAMGRAARQKAETMTIQREVGRWESLYTRLASLSRERSTVCTTATSGFSSGLPATAA